MDVGGNSRRAFRGLTAAAAALVLAACGGEAATEHSSATASEQATAAATEPASAAAAASLPVNAVRGQQALAPSPAEPCTLTPLGREPLTMEGGRELYVEAQSLFGTENGFLVAGSPSYLWRRVVAPRGLVQEAENRFVAALVEGSRVRPIEPPPGVDHIGHVRAVALPGARWAVVMSVVAAESTPFSQEVERVWYAEHDGEAWSSVEELPLPPVGYVEPFNSTDLVLAGDRLVWITPATVPDLPRKLIHFERHRGVWTSEFFDEDRVEDAALAYAPDAGLWLAVAGPDPDSSDGLHSLRLYRRADGWQPVRRVVEVGVGEHARTPQLTIGASDVTATWLLQGADGWVAMAARSIDGARPVGAETLYGPDVMQVEALRLDDGRPAWLVARALRSVLSSELRVIVSAPDGPMTIRTLPNPYTGYFSVFASGARVTLLGPEFNPLSAEPTVRSLLVDFGASCL